MPLGIDINSFQHIFFSTAMHIMLFFIFLTTLYWLIIAPIESKSLNGELNKAIKEEISKIQIPKTVLTDEKYNYLKAYFSGQDITLQKNNNLLVQLNITIIVFLIIIFIVTTFVRQCICNESIHFGELLLENIIVLILAGMIEYYFFINFASNYVPVLPSYMPSVVQTKLLDMLK